MTRTEGGPKRPSAADLYLPLWAVEETPRLFSAPIAWPLRTSANGARRYPAAAEFLAGGCLLYRLPKPGG